MSKKYHWLLLAAVLLLLFGGNSLMPVTDNVESNYALTAKEMVLSHDWISPRIYGHYWFDKPVMFYWLTALSYKLFGFTDLASRLAPGLSGLLSVILIGWCGRQFYSPRAGFWSMLILSSFVMFFALSKLIITDATLFLFFNATLLFFYLGYSRPQKNYYYVMYAAAALATLTKGPVGFLLPGLIIVLFLLLTHGWKELKHAHLCTGVLLFLVLAVPWYLRMYQLHGQDFLDIFLGVHNMLRATVAEHPRDNVIYYYTVLLLLMAFPWISFLPGALKQAFYKNKHWTRPADLPLFLILNITVVFIFFQNMATKYPTYTYPILGPLALLIAGYLDQNAEHLSWKGPLIYNTVFALLLAAAALLIPVSKIQLYHPALITIVLVLGYSWQWLIRRDHERLILSIGVTALAFNLCLIACVMIPLTQMRSAAHLTGTLEKLAPQVTTVISYGDYPTSAVYYSGKTFLRLIPDKKQADYHPQGKLSWSSKNVMPYLTFSQFRQQAHPLVVVNNSYRREFQESLYPLHPWKLLAAPAGWEIWQGQ